MSIRKIIESLKPILSKEDIEEFEFGIENGRNFAKIEKDKSHLSPLHFAEQNINNVLIKKSPAEKPYEWGYIIGFIEYFSEYRPQLTSQMVGFVSFPTLKRHIKKLKQEDYAKFFKYLHKLFKEKFKKHKLAEYGDAAKEFLKCLE